MPVTITKTTRNEPRTGIARALARLLERPADSATSRIALKYERSEVEQAYLQKLRAAEERPFRSARRIGGARS